MPSYTRPEYRAFFSTLYSGKGERVGMISAEREIFSPDAPQIMPPFLRGQIKTLPYPIPATVALHPSVVMSELVGEEITVDGVTYRGIIPDATVYFSTTETFEDVFRAINTLVEMEIDVINFSAGVLNPDGYSDFDKELDELILQKDFLFVAASGNRRLVSTPGIAYNTLTVGNLQTLSAPKTPISPPWNSRCINAVNCSGFTRSDDFSTSHKPDAVAPGTFIPFVTPSYRIYSENTGSSFATPLVTGVAVIVREILPDASALEIKTVICLSCDRDVIDESFNPVIFGEVLIRERTGCGMVNLERAISCAKNADIKSVIISGEYTEQILLGKAERVGVGVCFHKSTERQDESIVLRLASSSKELVCDRENQVLHIAEYTAADTETLTIGISGNYPTKCAVIIWRL